MPKTYEIAAAPLDIFGDYRPGEESVKQTKRPLQSLDNIATQKRLKASEERPNSAVQQSQENIAPQKQHKTSEKRPSPSIRFNYALGHLPQIDKNRLVRCKNEGCKHKSVVYCPKCNVHLCICIASDRNCFADYHTIPKSDA